MHNRTERTWCASGRVQQPARVVVSGRTKVASLGAPASLVGKCYPAEISALSSVYTLDASGQVLFPGLRSGGRFYCYVLNEGVDSCHAKCTGWPCSAPGPPLTLARAKKLCSWIDGDKPTRQGELITSYMQRCVTPGWTIVKGLEGLVAKFAAKTASSKSA